LVHWQSKANVKPATDAFDQHSQIAHSLTLLDLEMSSQRKLDVSLPVGEKPRWELDHTEADKELNSISDRYAYKFPSFFR
jgi:hypothetical protein